MDKPVTYTRIMVFLINAPLMAIAIQVRWHPPFFLKLHLPNG
jgi:hypothetical protein